MKELKRHLNKKTSNGASWLTLLLAFFVSSFAMAGAWQVTILENNQLALNISA